MKSPSAGENPRPVMTQAPRRGQNPALSPTVARPTLIPSTSVSSHQLQNSVLLVFALYASLAILDLRGESSALRYHWQGFVEFLRGGTLAQAPALLARARADDRIGLESREGATRIDPVQILEPGSPLPSRSSSGGGSFQSRSKRDLPFREGSGTTPGPRHSSARSQAAQPTVFAARAYPSLDQIAKPAPCSVPPSETTPSTEVAVQKLASPAPGNWTLGTKRVLVYRIQFPDDKDAPSTAPEINADLTEANSIFQHVSYGLFALEWEITPVLHLAQSKDWYAEKGTGPLLDDARVAAKVAGLDYLDFDLDLVRHHPVPGFAGGFGTLGGRGAWISTSGAYVIVHEIGHNLGLAHANFWDTSTPDSSPKISPPFPSNVNEGREGHAFDPDSIIGHDSVAGPGTSREYGDLFDIMGSGSDFPQFNAGSKYRLGWLPSTAVASVGNSGVYRIYSFAAPTITAERHYAIQISKDSLFSGSPRQYWVQFRHDVTNNAGLQNGVQLHLGDEANEHGVGLLLDATPGTVHRQIDSALTIGRTFTDSIAGIHITPLLKGGDGADSWVDVAIQFGEFPTNHAPSLTLNAAGLSVQPGQTVRFEALALDPDGDPLSYHWDFGDDSVSPNASQVDKSWLADGEFVVRCEVSDAKGGRASRHLVVTVGNPGTFRISGRVLDELGLPLAGVRVHNGRVFRNASDSLYVATWTDSTGAYTLAGLKPGIYTNAAFLFGYWTQKADSTGPIRLETESVSGSDFIAQALPTVTVTASPPAAFEGDPDAAFILTRNGSTNHPITLSFSVSGSAQPRADYIDFFVRRVIIPAGAFSVRLPVATLADGLVESAETLTLMVHYPSESKRTTLVEGTPLEYSVYFPGWELQPQGANDSWFQTYPDFMPTALSSATMELRDPTEAPAQLSIQTGDGKGWLVLRGQPGQTYRLEESSNLADWTSLGTQVLSGETATIEIPGLLQNRKYYRAILPNSHKAPRSEALPR